MATQAFFFFNLQSSKDDPADQHTVWLSTAIYWAAFVTRSPADNFLHEVKRTKHRKLCTCILKRNSLKKTNHGPAKKPQHKESKPDGLLWIQHSAGFE